MRRRGARLNIKPEFLTAFHGDLIDILLEGLEKPGLGRRRGEALTKSRGVQTVPPGNHQQTSLVHPSAKVRPLNLDKVIRGGKAGSGGGGKATARQEFLAKRDRILQCTGVQLDAELALQELKKHKKENEAPVDQVRPRMQQTKTHADAAVAASDIDIRAAVRPDVLHPPPSSAPASTRPSSEKHMTVEMDFESASATLSGRLVYKNKLPHIVGEQHGHAMEDNAKALSMELASSLEKVLTKLTKVEGSCCETRVSIYMGDSLDADKVPQKHHQQQTGRNTHHQQETASSRGHRHKNKRQRGGFRKTMLVGS